MRQLTNQISAYNAGCKINSEEMLKISNDFTTFNPPKESESKIYKQVENIISQVIVLSLDTWISMI